MQTEDTKNQVISSLDTAFDKKKLSNAPIKKFKDKMFEENRFQLMCLANMLIKAVKDDLSTDHVKCGNKYCNNVQPRDSKSIDGAMKFMGKEKLWLCKECLNAYKNLQFCEHCYQIYLTNTDQYSMLDGKEWCQCEGESCGRWSHVKCVAENNKITEEAVCAENFEYLCKKCTAVANSKKRAIPEKYFLENLLVE